MMGLEHYFVTSFLNIPLYFYITDFEKSSLIFTIIEIKPICDIILRLILMKHIGM